MKANTKLNLNYYEVNQYLRISNDIEIGSEEWYKAIKKAGYKFMYSWINSDSNWTFFAKTEPQAREGAAELFSKEKRRDIKFSRKYYYEYVGVISIDEYLSNI